MNPLLIVTADDFGLTSGVSCAIVRAHNEGIVTTASLLAIGLSFELAAHLARETPSLDLGVHLAMVGEDRPLLEAGQIRTLLDGRGRFPTSWRTALARLITGRIDPADVEREFAAQAERVRGAGIAASHLDTHQHLHLWPPIGDLLIRLARSHSIPAVRVPDSQCLAPAGRVIRTLSSRLRRRARAAGLAVTDAFAGLDQAGCMDRARLTRALRKCVGPHMRAIEINAHPGPRDDPDLNRFRWGYHWSDELEVLTDRGLRACVHDLGFRLGSYRDLITREQGH